MPTRLGVKPQAAPANDARAKLTSAEVANLWTQYMNDSLAVRFTEHSLSRAQDPSVRSILEFAQGLSLAHLEKIRAFLSADGYEIPIGFTEADLINPEAPALFSDDFLLAYFHVMSLLGLTSYAGALSTSSRSDQRAYFTACNEETMELFNRVLDAMVQKGLYVKPPILNASQPVRFVERQGYLAGWFGKERPLNAIEISSVFFNMVKIQVKIVLESAFSQVTGSKEIRDYLQRGVALCKEQFQSLGARLTENDLPLPRKWESEVTDSTTPPFSDKLMLFHVSTLISASAAFYGAALSVSQRRDLAMQYLKLIGEIGLFAEDGINILIKHGWLEEPPHAIDRDALLEQNKT